MESYSQIGQDRWVLSLFPEGYKGFFIDVGCSLPKNINNTLLLEEHGWDGVAFDIVNYSKQWKVRKTQFICADVLSFDFRGFGISLLIDYMSLDIDTKGTNYEVLKNLIGEGFEFKVITVEHNLYLGEEYNQAERLPQRELLLSKGYTLIRADIEFEDDGNAFEDWWINKKYINGLDTRRKV